MLWFGPMQCIVTDGTAIAGSLALFCCALEFASALLVPLFPTHWNKLKCNGSEGRCLRRLSTCNSAELTHIYTISYKVQIFSMLLEDASWGAHPHSCLLPCLYRSIWTFCRFRREIFHFPWLVCWCLSFVINICTDCAYCWSTESHHRIPKAIYWLQSVFWRQSVISKPNFVPSSSLLKFKIVTSDYKCVSFTKIVESLLENYSATCLPPDMY